jgi:signal transduction histidine kinase
MSEMSQYEDVKGASQEFAGYRYSPLLSSVAQRTAATDPAVFNTASSEMIAGLIHDTRNMVMALELYCDLLDEPGVLPFHFQHYAGELRLISGASRRLMESLDRMSLRAKRSVQEAGTGMQELPALNLLNFPDAAREGDSTRATSASSPSTWTGARAGGGPSGVPRPDSGMEDSASRSSSASRSGWFVDPGLKRVPSHGPNSTGLGRVDNPGYSTEPVQAAAETASEEFVSVDPAPAVSRLATTGLADQGRASVLPERLKRSRKPLDTFAEHHIENLADDLRANHNLLSALAGPHVEVSLQVLGGCKPVMMAPEDLTRVLVNLLRNAVEVMPNGGAVDIVLEEGPQYLALSFADTGPGIPRTVLDKVFSPGYSSHLSAGRAFVPSKSTDGLPGLEGDPDSHRGCDAIQAPDSSSVAPADSKLPSTATSSAWPIQHRGLGLSIVRAIVSAAGGSVWASNRTANSTAVQSSRLQQRTDAASSVRDPDLASFSQEARSHGAIIHIEFPLFNADLST